jgi:ribosomal protein S18 acetylase RimI-like enzyme
MFHLQKGINVDIATSQSLNGIVDFLSQPDIDLTFVRPLSQRSTSIATRVLSTFHKGFWLLARQDALIIGCRGCNGIIGDKPGVLQFSTTAVAPAFQNQGLGRFLIQQGVEVAFQRYSPRIMVLDSWSGNTQFEHTVTKLGFVKSREYEDLVKRPLGIKTVEYILDCRNWPFRK